MSSMQQSLQLQQHMDSLQQQCSSNGMCRSMHMLQGCRFETITN
jgi:hypothetical protein